MFVRVKPNNAIARASPNAKLSVEKQERKKCAKKPLNILDGI